MLFDYMIHPNEVVVVKFFGELDFHATQKIRGQLTRAIMQGDVRYIIWQLEHLSFMDSSGVGLILGRMRELATVDGQMTLLNPSPTMAKIFQFSGLGKYVQYASEQEAILQARGIVSGK